jgi:outer membrane protein
VLRLADAERVAAQQQPSLLQARALTRAAEGVAEQAYSGMLPQVTGTALYQHRYTSSNSAPTTTTIPTAGMTAPATGGFGSGSYDIWSFGVTANQLIWDFGQTYQRGRAADRSALAQRTSEQVTLIGVRLNVRRAYFQAWAQRALIDVARRTIENDTKHLGQTAGFVSVGTYPAINLVQAQTALANDRVTLVNAQNGYDLARSQLNQAMGTPGTLEYDVEDEELGPVPGEDGETDALVARAIAARPELAALDQQRDADELTISAIKGAFGPTLSASAGANESGSDLGNLGPSWNAGVTLTWPIFQGGLTRGQLAQAHGNLDSVRAQLEVERLQVRVDVEQAVLTVRSAKAAIAATEEALTNARIQLSLAEGRYTQGVGSIIELGDAQLIETNAEAQVVQAKYQLAAARAQLDAALGKR